MAVEVDGRSFGRTVRQIRERLGLSQKALGQAVSLSPSMITFLEAGERRPTRDQALRLAMALGLNPAETDAFLVSAGHLPRAYERTPASDRDLVLAADLLGDDAVPEEAKVQFRFALRLAALPWRPGVLDLRPFEERLGQENVAAHKGQGEGQSGADTDQAPG